jgi:hypothetical protein
VFKKNAKFTLRNVGHLFSKVPQIMKFDDDRWRTVSHSGQQTHVCKFNVIFHQYYVPARDYLPSKTHFARNVIFGHVLAIILDC